MDQLRLTFIYSKTNATAFSYMNNYALCSPGFGTENVRVIPTMFLLSYILALFTVGSRPLRMGIVQWIERSRISFALTLGIEEKLLHSEFCDVYMCIKEMGERWEHIDLE